MKYLDISRPKAVGTAAILLVCLALSTYLILQDEDRVKLRQEDFCHRAESDAEYIYLTAAEYISRPENRGIALKRSDLDGLVDVKSPWTLTTCGEHGFINVVDRGGKCPAEYQRQFKEWNSNIYILEF